MSIILIALNIVQSWLTWFQGIDIFPLVNRSIVMLLYIVNRSSPKQRDPIVSLSLSYPVSL